jgi:hypothetical protein
MNLNKFYQLWRTNMASKQLKIGTKPMQDKLRVQLIPTIADLQTANETKKAAQKLLAVMFSALHKRGRPKNEVLEEKSYAA